MRDCNGCCSHDVRHCSLPTLRVIGAHLSLGSTPNAASYFATATSPPVCYIRIARCIPLCGICTPFLDEVLHLDWRLNLMRGLTFPYLVPRGTAVDKERCRQTLVVIDGLCLTQQTRS